MAKTSLEALQRDLQSNASKVQAQVARVVVKGALEIKRAARASVEASRTKGKRAAGHFINYTMLGMMDAEIGYDKMAGSLGTMNEYGSVNNTPGNDLGSALAVQGPITEKYIKEAEEKLWRQH